MRAQLNRIAPGLLLCAAISAFALGVQALEQRVFGAPYLEAVALAIVIGIVVRTCRRLDARLDPGIQFGGHALLELAVVLLGASVSFQTLRASGVALLSATVAIVVTSICLSYAICRRLKLPPRMSLLIACGNSICGNSAIAAVAPVIGAEAADVASSIAFTAILGVAMVLFLPFLVPVLGLSAAQYGIFAGMTVYAVPQVLAATAPVSAVSVQVGTLVKLIRVAMLGPVVIALGWSVARSAIGDERVSADGRRKPDERAARGFAPWFVIGFFALAIARSLGLIPISVSLPAQKAADVLTILAMAALGLGVDLFQLGRAGPRATLAVSGSLIGLAAMSLAAIRLLGLA